ncbi:MAG: aldo/keto reductase [Planctomycetota bacterium]
MSTAGIDTALDRYVTLGHSGLRVSPLCLGTMTFGEEWGWGSTVDDSTAIIDAYLDKGGNFLDTANIYTKGHSEAIIGDHFSARGDRDRVVIATKCTGNMFLGDPNGGGNGRKALMASVDESLRRLKTDYIDLLWSHFWDQNTPITEMLATFDDLVRAGKVRYVGLSDHPAWVCASAQYECRANGWAPIVGLQIEHSLIERSVEGELMPMARELGMGVTPWSPLKYGILTGKYTRESSPKKGEARAADSKALDERAYTIIDALLEVAKEVNAEPAQVALRWVQDRPGVSSTIIGARTMKQLESNLGALGVSLSAEQTTRLDEASAMKQAFPFDFVEGVKPVIQGGTTINGTSRDAWNMAPANNDERW